MMNNLRSNKGLTLIEVLLAIIIATIVFGVALSLQLFGVRSFSMGTSQAEIQQNARLMDEVIRKELRNAVYIGIDEEYTVGNNDRTASNKLTFVDNKLRFGENGNTVFEFNVIETVAFEAENEKTLKITITGLDSDYVLTNVINLNNTNIPTSLDIDLSSTDLFYDLPD